MKLSDYIEQNVSGDVRLHLGCGGMALPGYVNVDLYPEEDGVQDSSRDGCAADVFHDVRNLELEAGSVGEILTVHVIEHFPRWTALEMLREWHSVLAKGGRLVIETPDLIRCMMWFFHPSKRKRELGRTQFYGNQWDRLDYETHRYVWTAKEMSKALLDIGFESVSVGHKTKFHHSWRDMRAIAIK